MQAQAVAALLLQAGAAGDAPEAAPHQLAALLGLLTLLAATAAVLVCVLAIVLWLDVSFARASALAYGHYRHRGRRCFLTGFVNLAVGLFLVLVLIGTQVLAFLGFLLLAAMGFVAVFGLAAPFRHLGARLLRRDEANLWPLLVGGIVAEFAFLVPVLGQILFAGVLIRGFGAAVMGILGARRERREARVLPRSEAPPEVGASGEPTQ